VLATQTPSASWHEQIGDLTYGDAILDRVVHNAYRIELTGPSLRDPQQIGNQKPNANNELSEDIPVTHTIHSRATTKAKKD
jgi:hypothetical protein